LGNFSLLSDDVLVAAVTIPPSRSEAIGATNMSDAWYYAEGDKAYTRPNNRHQ